MSLNTFDSSKKTFYYNFFPTKEEEEKEKEYSLKAREYFDWPRPPHHRRAMVEIRDMSPSPAAADPGWIKKTLNKNEVESGKLVLSSNDIFEHVLRYWSIFLADEVARGLRVSVGIWDVTQESYPRKYESGEAYLKMVEKDDFVLVCMALIKDRNLKVYDEIVLRWDSNKSVFKFKLSLR